MQPLEALTKEMLVVSGHNWELKERAKAARCVLEDKPIARTYRLSLAADHILEDQFTGQLLHQFSTPDVWACVPEEALTLEFRAKSFRVLSKMGASVHQTVRHPHQQYPVRLYRLLNQPSEAAAIAAEPICRKDPWTLQVQARHPTLEGGEVEAILHLHASVQSLDIAGIESRHASVRRQVVAQSVQTCRQAFAKTSACWLLQNYRAAKARGKCKRNVDAGKEKVLPPPPNPGLKQGTPPGPPSRSQRDSRPNTVPARPKL